MDGSKPKWTKLDESGRMGLPQCANFANAIRNTDARELTQNS